MRILSNLRIRRRQGFALALAVALVPIVTSATAGPVQRTYTQSLPAGVSLISLGVATNMAPSELFGPDCLAVRRWDPVSGDYVDLYALCSSLAQ